MTGASEMHERISTNLLAALAVHLRGTPCCAWRGDLKLAVGKDHYHPDVFVTCGPDRPEGVSRDDPVLIVEVLSKSTARIDRHEKRAAYERLSTSKEYVLVHQDRTRVEVRTVGSDEVRLLESDRDELRLESVGFSIPAGELYA